MTCAKIRRDLPLLAGGDLPARRERKLLAHIDRCPGCRGELEELRSAISRIKVAAREESVGDWTAAEWKVLMARITAEKPGKKRPAFGLRPRWAMASGVAAVILLAVLAFLLKDSIFKSQGTVPGQGPLVAKKQEPKSPPAKLVPTKPTDEKGKPVPVVQPEYLAKNAGQAPASKKAPVKAGPGQDVISVTMVSQETGLQVVWFFNRNFEWKGDQK
jgi:hypothetical protein